MSENINDKLSIKNMLFTRAIANYIPSVPLEGQKFYSCTDCGDRFIFESSFVCHVNRKSLKITYLCRHCNQVKCFLNRCTLLSHIRSHAFRTATINVSDLKIEPLPLSEYLIPVGSQSGDSTPTNNTSISSPLESEQTKKKKNKHYPSCSLCQYVFNRGCIDRASHFKQQSDETHECPICRYVLPNRCAFSMHLRIHYKEHPSYCPDCGNFLTTKNVTFPFNHFCKGFNVMRLSARLQCPMSGCTNFHPSEFKEHIKIHIKKVFKCSTCIVACFTLDAMERHLKKHPGNQKAVVFFQCLMCPGRLVLQHQLTNHLKVHHVEDFVFPCWKCDGVFKSPQEVVHHRALNTCGPSTSKNHKEIEAHSASSESTNASFRVVKRCDQCKRGFTYTCKFNEINDLPAECPYGCVPGLRGDKLLIDSVEDTAQNSNTMLCGLCDNKITQDWKTIKTHFAENHKEHKCVDIEIKITPLKLSELNDLKDTEGSDPKKRKLHNANDSENNKSLPCKKCLQKFDTKENLEEHLITHRDPCTAYQCLECGECYVVKPSFSKHLLVEHEISDVDDYVKRKQCFNEEALAPYQKEILENTEPIKENQCSICREQFENHDDLEKHFRTHGMAFLLKNNLRKAKRMT